MHLTLRHFEFVQAVHSHGSITLAAKVLGMSQPALSRAVKGLEEQIGGKLFETREGKLIATALAEVFIKRHETLRIPLEEILNDIDHLKTTLRGKIVLGTGMFAPFLSVCPAIAQLQQTNAALTFELIERDWRDIMVALLSVRIDIGIIDVSAAEENNQLAIEKLPPHACGIFVRKDHPLTTKRKVTTADLSRFPYCGTYPSRWAIERAGSHSTVFGTKTNGSQSMAAPIITHTLGAAHRMIISSNAFGIFPRVLLHQKESRGLSEGLSRLNVPELDWLSTNYGMIWRRSRPPGPALDAFMSQLRKVEAALVKEEARLAIPPPPLNHYSLTSGSARP